MKKISQLSTIILLIGFNYHATSQAKLPPRKWTVEQVKKMATPYGMQDSISETKNVLLLSMDKAFIQSYFKRQVDHKENTKQTNAYLTETANVRTYRDYVNVLKKHSSIRAAILKNRGITEQEQDKLDYEAMKINWRIYRNKSGGLYLERADKPVTEGELKFGKRIDNLPKE